MVSSSRRDAFVQSTNLFLAQFAELERVREKVKRAELAAAKARGRKRTVDKERSPSVEVLRTLRLWKTQGHGVSALDADDSSLLGLFLRAKQRRAG
jgi:hypothetical protein